MTLINKYFKSERRTIIQCAFRKHEQLLALDFLLSA